MSVIRDREVRRLLIEFERKTRKPLNELLELLEEYENYVYSVADDPDTGLIYVRRLHTKLCDILRKTFELRLSPW